MRFQRAGGSTYVYQDKTATFSNDLAPGSVSSLTCKFTNADRYTSVISDMTVAVGAQMFVDFSFTSGEPIPSNTKAIVKLKN